MEKPIDLSSNKEGLFELSYTITETRWKLGVLDGEIGFNLNNAEVYIPTKNYVEGNDSKNLKLESTGIPVKGYDIVEGYDIFSDLGRNLEILMGDNLVELYFKHPSFPIYILERYATKGNVIDDAFKDERSYKKYTEALKLLNLGKEQEVTSAANTDDLFMHLYK